MPPQTLSPQTATVPGPAPILFTALTLTLAAGPPTTAYQPNPSTVVAPYSL